MDELLQADPTPAQGLAGMSIQLPCLHLLRTPVPAHHIAIPSYIERFQWFKIDLG